MILRWIGASTSGRMPTLAISFSWCVSARRVRPTGQPVLSSVVRLSLRHISRQIGMKVTERALSDTMWTYRAVTVPQPMASLVYRWRNSMRLYRKLTGGTAIPVSSCHPMWRRDSPSCGLNLILRGYGIPTCQILILPLMQQGDSLISPPCRFLDHPRCGFGCN